MQSKFKNLAFAGLISLNLLRPSAMMDKNASPEGRSKEKLKERIENRIEKFKDTRAALKNVKITAVGSTSITVDNAGTSVVVNITEKTQLRRKFWGKSEIAEFSVGDNVDVQGRWTDDTKTAINAVMIRNESIQKRFGVFFGEVKSLTGAGFTFTSIHRDDQTVTIGSAKLINRKGETITQADIKVGQKVRVRGLWDRELKTITETKEIKNFSLPVRPSSEPKASSTPVASP